MCRNVRVGDYIEMNHMECDDEAVPPGTRGWVLQIGTQGRSLQIDVDWENSQDLCVIIPPDTIRVIREVEDMPG